MCTAQYDKCAMLSVVVGNGVGVVGGCCFKMYMDDVAGFCVVNVLEMFFDDCCMMLWSYSGELSCID